MNNAIAIKSTNAESDVLIPEIVSPLSEDESSSVRSVAHDPGTVLTAKVLTDTLPVAADCDLCGTKVRAFVDQHDNQWFVGTDVLEALGLTTGTAKHYMRLDADEKVLVSRADLGLHPGKPMTLISEPGLYRLIFRSRKPEAKRFVDWVCYEVLPSIRENGGYFTPGKVQEFMNDADEAILKYAAQIAERIIVEQETRREKAADTYVLKLTPYTTSGSQGGDLLINRIEYEEGLAVLM